MESDMSLLLILLPPHTIFFTRSKNPRFIVGTLVDFFEVLERTRLDSHRGRPSLLHFPRSICHRWTWTRHISAEKIIRLHPFCQQKVATQKNARDISQFFWHQKGKKWAQKTIYQKCKWSQLDNTCLLFFCCSANTRNEYAIWLVGVGVTNTVTNEFVSMNSKRPSWEVASCKATKI